MMSVEDYKDKHLGDRVFLIGNGPSLANTPLHLLEEEYTIAMNKIDMIYNKTTWRPSYYLQVNPTPRPEPSTRHTLNNIERNITSFIAEDVAKIFPHDLCGRDYVHCLNRVAINDNKRREIIRNGNMESIWSNDISEVIYNTATSMYAAAQLASYMGFTKFYFVGCDLYPTFKPLPYTLFKEGADPQKYEKSSDDFYDLISSLMGEENSIRSLINGIWYSATYGTILMRAIYKVSSEIGMTDKTHFTDDYLPIFYTEYMNEKLEKTHEFIKEIGGKEGFECYNATIGGELEVYERIDLDKLLAGVQNS